MNFPKPLRRPGALILAASVAALLAPSTVRAASGTWGNTATDWNTNSSWSLSAPPGAAATDVATFNAVTPAFQPNISTSVTTGRIVFGTGGWTLSSTDATKTLTLLGTGTSTTTAALINTGTNTISAPLIFGATGAQWIRNNSSSVLYITGSITKSDSGELQFNNGSTTAISVSGNITAAGKVSVTGGSGVTLSGSNSAGSWDIGSAINLNSANALGNSGAINFNIASTSGGLNFTSFNNTDYSSRFTISLDQNYVFNASTGVTVTFASALVGNGTNAFRVGGSTTLGTFILGNAGNSFSGPVTVGGGALSVAGIGNANNNSYLGKNGTINLGASATAGTLIYTGAGETSDKVINLGGTTGGGTIQADNASGLLKFTSNTTAAASAKTLTLRGVGTGEFAGVISNDSGTVALTKADAGTWTLSNNNTYTGATSQTGGTLNLNGNLSGTSGITVNNATAVFNQGSSSVISGASATFTLTAGAATLAGNNTYGGLTTVTNGPLVGVGANAFGSTPNISIAGAGILSLRGDTSTAFTKASDSSPITVSTSATGATINVNQATIAGTAAKIMTLGAIGNSSTTATWKLNFTGGNNTGLTVGAITGPASTATATTELANANTSGLLTIASYTSANTSGGETLTISGAGNTTITGAITPSATALALNITSTGTTTLNGNSAYTGQTNLSQAANATVIVGHKNALGSGQLRFGSSAGTTLFQANTDLSGANAIANNVLLNSNVTTISGSNNITFNGTWTNNGTVRTLTSSLDPGKTLVLAGTVNLTDGTGAYGLVLNGTGDTTISGNITPGTGLTAPTEALRISNTGTTRLSGNNTYSGQTRLYAGTTVMDSATALPSTSNLILNGGVLGLGTGNTAFTRALGNSAGQVRFQEVGGLSTQGGFAAYGANATVNLGGSVTPSAVVWGTTAQFIPTGWTFLLGSASADATVDFQNPLGLGTSGTNTRTIQVNNGSAAIDAVLSGVISGNANQTFSKTGTGTLALTANNTYSGATTVTGGALQVGSTGRTGTGAVTVQTGSVILGTGVVRGSTFTAQSSSTVQAGDGTAQSNYGTLTFTPVSGSGSFDFQSGSSIILGINPGGVGDLISFDGLSNGTLLFNGNLSVTAPGYNPVSVDTFNLLDWANLSTTTFHSRFSSASYSGFLLGNGDDNLGFDLPDISSSGYGWDISQFTVNGTISTVFVIPEPSRALLLMLGLAGLVTRRRRKC